MPNILVEYSANIRAEADIPGLLKRIAGAVQTAGGGLFPLAGVRVRAVGYEDCLVGDGDPEHAFVLIGVKVARGRSEADRRRTFDAVFEQVKAHLKPVSDRRMLAISMDVEEFGDRLAYKQNPLHERFGTKPFAKASS